MIKTYIPNFISLLLSLILFTRYSLIKGQYDNRGSYDFNNPVGNLPAPRSVEYNNGVLLVNGISVPSCFWYDNGRYILNRQVPLVVNNRRIPDYYLLSPAQQSRMASPGCPQRNSNPQQQYGNFNPNVQTVRQTIQHRRGQLRINGIQVPQCFWYDRGRFFVDRQTPYEIIINGRRIPEYYVNLELQRRSAPPTCPGGRWNSSPTLRPGHTHLIKIFMSCLSIIIFRSLY